MPFCNGKTLSLDLRLQKMHQLALEFQMPQWELLHQVLAHILKYRRILRQGKEGEEEWRIVGKGRSSGRFSLLQITEEANITQLSISLKHCLG